MKKTILKTKRVLGFTDAHDEIPADAEYLFSKEHTYHLEETDDQRAKRVIDGSDDKPTLPIFVHYYEVSSEDYDRMILDFDEKKKSWPDRELPDKVNAHIEYIKKLKTK
jgi:hypothetical protein